MAADYDVWTPYGVMKLSQYGKLMNPNASKTVDANISSGYTPSWGASPTQNIGQGAQAMYDKYKDLYQSLTPQSTPQDIAKAYYYGVGSRGGDITANRQAAQDWLDKLGIGRDIQSEAYKTYQQTYFTTPVNVDPNYKGPAGFLGRGDFSGVARYDPELEGSGNPQTVIDAYQRFLGRAPTQNDINVGMNQLNAGITGAGIVNAFTMSPEFLNRQDYNRAYTAAFRPGYQEFSPSGQYNQPIYQSSYSRYSAPPAQYRPTYNTAPLSLRSSGSSFNPLMPSTSGAYGALGRK